MFIKGYFDKISIGVDDMRKIKLVCKLLAFMIVTLLWINCGIVKANNEQFEYQNQFGYTFINNVIKFKYYSSTANKISVAIEGVENPVMLEKSDGSTDNIWGGAINGEGLMGKEYSLIIEDNAGNVFENVLDPYGRYTNEDGSKNVLYSGNESDFEEWVNQNQSLNIRDKNKIIYGIHIENFTKHTTWKGSEEYRSKLLGLIESETNTYLTGYDYVKSLGITYLELSELNNQDIPFAIDYKFISGNQVYSGEEELKKVVNSYYYNNIGIVLTFNHEKLSSKFLQDLAIIDSQSYLSENGDLDFSKPMIQEYINELLCHYVKTYKLEGLRIKGISNYPIDFMNKLINNLKSINENIIIYGDGSYKTETTTNVGENNLNKTVDLKLINGSLSYGLIGDLKNNQDRGYLDGDFSEKNKESLKHALLSGVDNGQINYSLVGGVSYKQEWDISSAYQIINYIGRRDGLSIYDKLSMVNIYNDNFIKQKIILGYGLMMMSGGIPYIYSGEEFLMSYLDAAKKDTSVCDQSNIFCYHVDEEYKVIDWSTLNNNKDISNAVKSLINNRKSSNSVAQTEVKVIKKNVKTYENQDMPGVIGLIRNYPNAPTKQVEKVVAMFNFSNNEYSIEMAGEGWHGLETHNGALRDGENIILKGNSIYTEVKEKQPKIHPLITLFIVIALIGLLYYINIILNRKLMSKKGYDITDIKKKYRPFMKKVDKNTMENKDQPEDNGDKNL